MIQNKTSGIWKAWFHEMTSDLWTPKDLWFLGDSGFQDLSQSISKFTLNVWSLTVLEKWLGRKPNKLSSKHCQISGATLSELNSPYKWPNCDKMTTSEYLSMYLSIWAALLLISKAIRVLSRSIISLLPFPGQKQRTTAFPPLCFTPPWLLKFFSLW